MAKKKINIKYPLMENSYSAYREFINRLALLHKRYPDLLKTTLANIFTMRYIGNKTHGDMAEIGITEFVNKFLYDYDCKHVGKEEFRTKEHDEDIVVKPSLNNEKGLYIPISLKAYGIGPLQLSTDKVENPKDGLYNQIEKICKNNIIDSPEKINKVFELKGFKAMTNVLPIIYEERKEAGGKCNILIFNLARAIEDTRYIYHVKKGQKFDAEQKKVVNEKVGKKKKRVYPIFLFLNKDYEYVCEVRYGGKDANALQRGIWSDTKKGIKYFDSFDDKWIEYEKQEHLLNVIVHALNSSQKSHEDADKILISDITKRTPTKENG